MVVQHALVAVLSLSLLGPATEASGQTSSDERGQTGFSRLGVTGQLGATFNNPGLQNTLSMAWSKPLGDSTNPLLAGAAVTAGIVSVTTPTMTRAGAWLEYAPLSIFAVRAGVEPVGYFGTFSSLMPFSSYNDDYSQDTLSQKKGTTAGAGLRSYITPIVQFRAGPVAARVSADLEWWRSSADGSYFYEATRDQLLASTGDGLLSMTAVALYEHQLGDGSLSAGVFHGLTRVFAAPGNKSQRLGAIATRQFRKSHFRLPRPSLTVLLYQYLDDPSKKHSLGGAVAIGFRTNR